MPQISAENPSGTRDTVADCAACAALPEGLLGHEHMLAERIIDGVGRDICFRGGMSWLWSGTDGEGPE